MVSFKPERIEATILHLTKKEIQEVKLPQHALHLASIENRVKELLIRSKSDQSPTVGEGCKFCEFKKQCSAFKESERVSR